MWRSPCTLLRRKPLGFRQSFFSSEPLPTITDKINNNNNNIKNINTNNNNNNTKTNNNDINSSISLNEAKKLMRLVNVEALKRKLGTEEKEMMLYNELLEACEKMGVANSKDEAVAFVRVMDEAGVVLVFRDRVYLHPDKVVDLVRKAVPLALTSDDDPRREELKSLLEKKQQLDILAHKQVRCILWTGLGGAVLQVGLFFRLTFWEFSWDVMEPIAFFTTATGIVVGYAYFLFTSRDPTYQDFMQRLFLSRQRKLIKKHNFDFARFVELQKKCNCPFDGHSFSRKTFGMDMGHEDSSINL